MCVWGGVYHETRNSQGLLRSGRFPNGDSLKVPPSAAALHTESFEEKERPHGDEHQENVQDYLDACVKSTPGSNRNRHVANSEEVNPPAYFPVPFRCFDTRGKEASVLERTHRDLEQDPEYDDVPYPHVKYSRSGLVVTECELTLSLLCVRRKNARVTCQYKKSRDGLNQSVAAPTHLPIAFSGRDVNVGQKTLGHHNDETDTHENRMPRENIINSRGVTHI